MDTDLYWRNIGIITGIYVIVPVILALLIKPFHPYALSDSPMHWLFKITYAHGATLLDLIASIGLTAVVYRRLKYIKWSGAWAVFLFLTLAAGLVGLTASQYGIYRFSMLFGWSLLPALAFIIFLGFYDAETGGLSDMHTLPRICKVLAALLALVFALVNLKGGLNVFTGIPFISDSLDAALKNVPKFYQVYSPAFKLGIHPHSYQNGLIVLFCLSIGLLWHFQDYFEDAYEDNDATNYYVPPSTTHNTSGFGRRNYE